MTPQQTAECIKDFLCESCREGYPCAMCKLYQFDNALDLVLNEGRSPEEAIMTVNKNADAALTGINRKYDEREMVTG